LVPSEVGEFVQSSWLESPILQFTNSKTAVDRNKEGSMTRKASVGCILTVVATLAIGVGRVTLAQGADPRVGTWKMNLTKSKFSPGPGPKELMLVYTAEPSGRMSLSLKGIDPEGKPINANQNIIMDEKDHPTTDNPNWDATSWKHVDARTYEVTRKKSGKVVQTGTNTVSADGKTLTLTQKGVSPAGTPNSTATIVFDKS
jgi:hypothetical protein